MKKLMTKTNMQPYIKGNLFPVSENENVKTASSILHIIVLVFIIIMYRKEFKVKIRYLVHLFYVDTYCNRQIDCMLSKLIYEYNPSDKYCFNISTCHLFLILQFIVLSQRVIIYVSF